LAAAEASAQRNTRDPASLPLKRQFCQQYLATLAGQMALCMPGCTPPHSKYRFLLRFSSASEVVEVVSQDRDGYSNCIAAYLREARLTGVPSVDYWLPITIGPHANCTPTPENHFESAGCPFGDLAQQ
jgi:hypothetical protein